MLYEIESSATTKNAAILLHPSDNIAVARVVLSPGQVLELGTRSVVVSATIPAGHKVALARIPRGHAVFRYGNGIGSATKNIEVGEHVHTHNLGFDELQTRTETTVPRLKQVVPSATRTFLGFERFDGRVGTRNYVAVVAASNCAAHTAELIAQSFSEETLPPNVDGVVAFPHGEGCGHTIGLDTEQLQRTLSGVLHHPNVSAAIILGLGCEVNQVSHYLAGASSPSESLHGITLQEAGGTSSTVDEARRQIRRFLDRASAEQRTEQSASKINLGLNCGGSDSFSGITANPALGYCCDLIVAQGGTVVLAETTECFGAEHLLAARAVSQEVGAKFLNCISRYKAYLRQFGGSFNDNPSPGNKEGGLSNILEKSLGAVAKAGSTPLTDVVDYSGSVTRPGFVFMDTPGYDPVSITGLAAGGANLIAFTTGRGSAIGFPSVPVLKIASNSALYRRMADNMDLNAGRIADGNATVESVGQEIFEKLLSIASGERTRAEKLGHHEFAPWRIGPVL